MSGRLWGRAFAAALVVAGASAPTRAAEETPFNRVDFQVERSREVANDWARAVATVTDEDRDPAALADRVNRDASWGLETARARQGIQVRTGGYSTHPINDPKRGEIRTWRASQELILETADTAALAELLGVLQSRLELRGVSFSVSPGRRRDVEAELIDEALAAFQARALRIASQLGASGYRLVQLSVQPSGGPPPVPQRMQLMAAEAVAPPAFEGGSSTLSVHVSGTIELK